MIVNNRTSTYQVLVDAGEPGEWVVRPQGRPRVDGEPLVNVNVKFTRSMVAAIDAKGGSRSAFIRKAVAAAP